MAWLPPSAVSCLETKKKGVNASYPDVHVKLHQTNPEQRTRRTHRDHAELHLLVQLQLLLLYNLRHVEVELRVVGALDEPRVVTELDHNALVRNSTSRFGFGATATTRTNR